MECLLCDGIHKTNQCLYPRNVRRCRSCTAMVFGNEPHTCSPNATSQVQYYRTVTLASTPEPVFKLRVLNIDDSNGAEIHFLNPVDNKFCQFFKTTSVLSPATSGIFTMHESGKHLTLHYEATKFNNFSFYIALLSYNRPTIELRAVITRQHGLVLVKANMVLNSINGNISIPEKYRLSTTLVMGLKPRSKNLQLQFKSGDRKMTANWQTSTGWTIDPQLDGGNCQRSIGRNPPQQTLVSVCHNCNKDHNIEDCDLPEYSMHCTSCLVVSFNGSNHVNPCMPMPINRISPIRSDLFARQALTLFQINYSLNDVRVYHLDKGRFSEVNPRVKLISPPAEGVLTIQNLDNQRQCIALKQSSFKRCSILFAVMDKSGIWRLRWRAVLTPNSGLLIFKLTKTLSNENGLVSIPPEFRLNTIALFGMKPCHSNFYAEVRVHANENGHLSTSTFDGYVGHIGIDFSSNPDRVFIDNALDGNEPKSNDKKFNHHLYRHEPRPISTFQSQRVAPSIAR